MRCLYREKKYKCGEYLDVDIYPVFKSAPAGKRSKKAKPTSSAQARLNQHNREKKFSRLVCTNFTPADLCVHYTYNDDNLPKDDAAVKKAFKNYINRLKRFRKKNNLPELKYMSVIEKGSRNGRYHHHVILNCGDMKPQDLVSIWGKGFVDIKVLQFDECGVEGLARYFCKNGRKKLDEEDEDNGETIGYSWSCSRNLEKPKESKRDGRLSARSVADLSSIGNDGKAEYEKLYPGYSFSQAHPFYNDVNGGFYISVRLRKIPEKKSVKKKVS